jgi:hypothetical protein
MAEEKSSICGDTLDNVSAFVKGCVWTNGMLHYAE